MGTPRIAVAKDAKAKIQTACDGLLATLASCQTEATETIEAHDMVQRALDAGDLHRATLLLVNASIKQRARDEHQTRLVAYVVKTLGDIEGVDEQVDPAAAKLIEQILQGRAA
jgi:hypothetical protein